jgi:hypothetical protein
LSFSLEDFKHLSEQQDAPAVSLYIKTHEAGKDTRENPIRFKNQLRDAETQLDKLGYTNEGLGDLLDDARAHLDDHNFWQHQRAGLAYFVKPGETRYYKLPLSFEDRAVVGQRFHLNPLVSLLTNNGRFYLLAASLNNVRLFEATRFDISEVTLDDDVPLSLDEYLRFDDPEKSVQHYSTSQGSAAGSGQGSAAFYGTGAGDDDKKTDVLRYFQQLDNGVRKQLGADTAPLVFWGVEYLFPIYREANHYNYFLEEAVVGSPEQLDAQEIHSQAWEFIKPHFQQVQADALANYANHLGTDQTLEDITAILPAAFDGRIDSLFIADKHQLWGTYNYTTRSTEVQGQKTLDNEDLINVATLQTVSNGGQVYKVKAENMPNNSQMAALLRY